MRKEEQKLLYQIVSALLGLLFPIALQAQHNDPTQWNTFVQGKTNTAIQDTFRMQTFEEGEIDNWTYTFTGNVERINTTALGIKGQGGSNSLKLPLGSSVTFETFTSTPDTSVIIRASYAGKALMPKENLHVNALRPNANVNVVWANVTAKNYSFNYRENTRDDNNDAMINPILISSNPQNLTLTVSAAATNTANGYYCIDSVYACGSIQEYSLFTGTGNWETATLWSHAPAARHRNALVAGKAVVTATTQCNKLSIGQGSVHINPNTRLNINDLELYGAGSTLTSAGTLSVKGAVSLHHTFPEAGKWYFLSFPFDVYQAGLDPAFQLGDEQTIGSGNILYIRIYDGAQRAQTGKASGNWKVVSANAQTPTKPIFERGKGYLVALDAAATSRTLTFSSKGNSLPNDFAQSAKLTITAPAGSQEAHNGWQLCGNPLPAPVPLSRLPSTQGIGRYIYLYNGSSYTAHLVNGSQLIPPLTAFFIKASASAEIELRNNEAETTGTPLVSQAQLNTLRAEPKATEIQTSIAEPEEITCRRQGNHLIVENLPESGWSELLDMNGSLLQRHPLSAGQNVIHLPQQPGIYLLSLRIGNYRAQHKIRISPQGQF